MIINTHIAKNIIRNISSRSYIRSSSCSKFEIINPKLNRFLLFSFYMIYDFFFIIFFFSILFNEIKITLKWLDSVHTKADFTVNDNDCHFNFLSQKDGRVDKKDSKSYLFHQCFYCKLSVIVLRGLTFVPYVSFSQFMVLNLWTADDDSYAVD